MWSLLKILNKQRAKKNMTTSTKRKLFKPHLDILEARITPSTNQIVFAIEPFVDKQVDGKAVYSPDSTNYIIDEFQNASKVYLRSFWNDYLSVRGETNPQDTLEKIYTVLFSPQGPDKKSLHYNDPRVEALVSAWGDNPATQKRDFSPFQALIKGINQGLHNKLYETIINQSPEVKPGNKVVYVKNTGLDDKISSPFDINPQKGYLVPSSSNILQTIKDQSDSRNLILRKFTSIFKSEDSRYLPVFLISNGIYSENSKSYPMGYTLLAGSGENFQAPITVSLSSYIYNGIKATGKNQIVSRDILSKQIANTIVHEFGHTLGIDHPTAGPDNTSKAQHSLNDLDVMSYNRNKLKSTFINTSAGLFKADSLFYTKEIQNAGKEVLASANQPFYYRVPNITGFSFFDEEIVIPELIQGEEPPAEAGSWNINQINASINALEAQIENKIKDSIYNSLAFQNPLLSETLEKALSTINVEMPFPDQPFASLDDLKLWLSNNSANFEFNENDSHTLFHAVSGGTYSLSFDNSHFALSQNYLASLGLDQASITRLSNLLAGIEIEGDGGLSFEFQFGFDSKGAYFVPTGEIVGSLGLSDSKPAFQDPNVPGLEIDPELNANFLLSASLGEFGVRQYSLPNTMTFQVEGDISAGLAGVYKVGNGWAELPFNYNYRMNYDGSSFAVDPSSGFDLQGFKNEFLDNIKESFALVGQGALDVFNKIKMPGEMTRILGDLSDIPQNIAAYGSSLFNSANFLNSPLSVNDFLANPQSILKTNFSFDQNLTYSQQIGSTEFSIGGNSILKAKQTFTGSVDVQADLNVKAQFLLDFENGNIDLEPGSIFTININPSATLNTTFKPIPGILEGVGTAGIGFFHNGQKGLVASTKFNGSSWESSVDGDFQITADLKARILNEVEVTFQAMIPGKELSDGEFDLGDIVVTSNTDDLKQQLINKIEARKNELYRNMIRKMADTKAVPDAVKRFLKEFVSVYQTTMPGGLNINDLNVSTINKYLPPDSKIVISGSQVDSANDLNQFADNNYGESDEKFFKFQIPLIDSAPNVIAQFLVGQKTDIDLITAEINPKFDVFSQEIAVTPDIPLFTVGIADISVGVRMAPKVSIESYMKFGIDTQGIYLHRDSKPIAVSANLKFEAALSGNVLVGVQFASVKLNVEFDLKKYGIALPSNEEKIRSFGDINDRLIFEGTLDGNLTGDIWLGVGTRAVAPGQPIVGIGIETSVVKLNLDSRTLTTEFTNPMAPIREEFNRIRKMIGEHAECAAAGGALGSAMGGLPGVVIGAVAGASICEADLFPSLAQMAKNVEGFLKDPRSTTIEEVNRWREQGGKIWNDLKQPWNNFVKQLEGIPGVTGQFIKFFSKNLADANEKVGKKLEQSEIILNKLVTGDNPKPKRVSGNDLGKKHKFVIQVNNDEIVVDLSAQEGNINILFDGNNLVAFGQKYQTIERILEFRKTYCMERVGPVCTSIGTEKDESKGNAIAMGVGPSNDGYQYEKFENLNSFSQDINGKKVLIKGGGSVKSVSFSSSDGNVPKISYQGGDNIDNIYTEVDGYFDLGSGSNVFVASDTKILNCGVSTGNNSDNLSFGPGSFSWRDSGGDNTVSTEKGTASSSFNLTCSPNGFYKIFGGSGVETIAANGSKVFGQLMGGDDRASDLGADSEVWLGDEADWASVAGSNVKVYGEGGNDILHGSAFSDYLNGGDGANELWGHDGDDVLLSMVEDNSILVGGKGNDLLLSKEGSSIYIGPDISWANLSQLRADISIGSVAVDPLNFYGIDQAPGNDLFLGNGQDNIFVLGFSQKGAGFTDGLRDMNAKTFFGGPDDDLQTAKMKADANWVVSDGGHDFILGGNGRDVVQFKDGKIGGFLFDGDDHVVIRDGCPDLDLGLGDDLFVIKSGGGNRPSDKGTVYGNSGKDTFYVFVGDNEFHGGDDDDLFIVTSGDNKIYGGQETDTLLHIGTEVTDNWILDKNGQTSDSGNPLDELSIGTQEGASEFSSIENLVLDLGGGNDQLSVNWAPVNSKVVTYLGLGDDQCVVNFDQDSAYGIQIRGGTADIPFAGQDLLEVRMKTSGALTRDLGNGGQFGTVMGSYAEGGISYIEYVGMRATTPGMTLNKAFIQSLYHNSLQRNGAPSEVDSWVPTLASFGIAGVIKRVMQSEEFSQMTVRDWYQMYLGRTASLAEMRPWIDMLKSGNSLEQVLPEMVASPEYFNRNGGTMGNFVQAIYRDFLDRAGSKAEFDSWLVPLSRKMARQDMVRQVMGSVEYRRLVVQRFYSLFLRRGEDVPSTLEFPQWVERNLPSEKEITSWIYNGKNLSRVSNGFAASMEFFWFGR